MKTVVEDLMAEYGIRPNKQRGQNFLIDDEVYDAILETATLSSTDLVLEIGPGLGTLTELLAEHCSQVVAIEVDEKLQNLVEQRLSGLKTVNIVHGDILDKPVARWGIKKPYKIVANIPYNITSPIIKKFLVDDVAPQSMTLLVQKEVAERIIAKPGQLSLLAISVQLYAEAKIARVVPAQAFLPPPAVDSCILHIYNLHKFPYSDIDERFWWRVLKIGFAAKRKQLKKNLANGLHLEMTQLESIFSKIGLKHTARAQELSLDEWHALVKFLR